MFQIIFLKIALISNTYTDFITVIILNIFIAYFWKQNKQTKNTHTKKTVSLHAGESLFNQIWSEKRLQF